MPKRGCCSLMSRHKREVKMVLNELSNQPCTFLCRNALAVYHWAFSLTVLSTSHCIVNRAEKADFFPKPTGNFCPFSLVWSYLNFLLKALKPCMIWNRARRFIFTPYSFILSHVFRDCGTHSSSKSYSCANEILGTRKQKSWTSK